MEDYQVKYMLLDRLLSDCKSYIDGSSKALWGITVEGHIAKMKEIYNSFSEEDKPLWITLEDIEHYEELMKGEQL